MVKNSHNEWSEWIFIIHCADVDIYYRLSILLSVVKLLPLKVYQTKKWMSS